MRKQTPITTKNVDRGVEMSHPSFAMISLNRTTGAADLFGSSINHQHFLTLIIRRAVKIRDEINTDWYHAHEELIEVAMSNHQFGELLTNMNNGFGAPCTLRRAVNKSGQYEEVPEADGSVITSKEVYIKEFKDRMALLTGNLHDLYAKAKEMEEKPSVTKADRKDLSSKISSVISEIKTGMPWMLEQYIEQVEKVTVEAKSEIEAFKSNTLHQAGIAAIAANEVKQLPAEQ